MVLNKIYYSTRQYATNNQPQQALVLATIVSETKRHVDKGINTNTSDYASDSCQA